MQADPADQLFRSRDRERAARLPGAHPFEKGRRIRGGVGKREDVAELARDPAVVRVLHQRAGVLRAQIANFEGAEG
jgi:hypothetical protein